MPTRRPGSPALSSRRGGRFAWRVASQRRTCAFDYPLVTRNVRRSSGRRQRTKPLCERLYPKRLMGLEPTAFRMASRSSVFGEARKALQIGLFLASAPKGDARGLPAIHGDLADQWQTASRASRSYRPSSSRPRHTVQLRATEPCQKNGVAPFVAILIAVMALSAALGFASRRLAAVAVAAAAVVVFYVGLDSGWWGDGVGDGWQTVMAAMVILNVLLTAAAATVARIRHR